jgi:glutamate carboxypeptidase
MKPFRTPLLALAAALALTAFAPAAEARLAPAERKMAEVVDREQARMLGLLETLVNQNSGTLNSAGVEAVGRMMRAELEPLGFQVRWVPITEANRAGHIVAAHRGNGQGKRMLLIGHLDTVFEPDSPFQKFRMKDDDTAEGPGVGDDKGGMVVMLAALRAMHQAGTLKGADIEIVLTGDEEDAGTPISVSRRDLIEAGRRADVALDFEGLSTENGRDMGSIARRGSADWELRTTGRSGHSSRIFSEQSGKNNIIPETAIARGDIRTLSLDQYQRVTAKMKEIASRHLPGTSAKLEFEEAAYPPMAPTAGSQKLLDRLNAVNADMGLASMEAQDPLKRGAGDIGFVAADVDGGLVGLGPAGAGSHAAGETIDVPSLWRQAKRAAILMTRLSKEKR